MLHLPIRHAAAAALTALFIALPVHVDAQSCHPVSLHEPSKTGFSAGFTTVMATFSDTEHGNYQGLIPVGGWHHPWISAELALPWYRLESEGDEAIGLGDALADVRVAVFRADSGLLALGPELAVSLPTGNADDDLGMGHVMVMPGAWLRVEWRQLSVMAQLAYGRALADLDAHAEHEGHDHGAPAHATPRVNPMNMSELAHALGVSYAVDPHLAVTARWLGGVPLDDAGFARQTLGPGLQLTADALYAALDVQIPIAGDPFDMRLSISLGAEF